MAKNFNSFVPEGTDPADAQRRADAWGVNVDDHTFATPEDYLNADKQALTENEFGQDVFNELDNGSASEQESIYSGHSLKEMIEVLRDAEAHNDKSTSFEVQAALQTYLEKAIEKGELTDDGAMNLIDQIDRMTKAGTSSGEDSPVSPTSVGGDNAPRAISPEDIAKLQNTTKENWEKTPSTTVAITPEASAQNAYPSSDDIEAARRASGETSASEAPATPATTGETEPTVDDKEKSKEKRMSKIRRGFNRALGWLMAEKKDNESSEDETKAGEGTPVGSTAPKAAGMLAGIRESFAITGAERRTKRAARTEDEPVAIEDGEKAPEPTEADKSAAAAAVKNAEIATDARGAGKPSDDEWGPGVPGDPIPGSPEVATSSSSFPEVEKAFAEAEKRVKEAEAKAQELEASQPEVVGAGEDGGILTPAGEQLLRDRVQAKREAEVAKGRLTMIKSMIERDQQNKREADYAQEAFAEAEKRVKEAEAKAQELKASQPEAVAAGEDGSILTPAGEQLLRDKAAATLRAKEARGRADDLKVRVDSSARDLAAYRQFVLEALN